MLNSKASAIIAAALSHRVVAQTDIPTEIGAAISASGLITIQATFEGKPINGAYYNYNIDSSSASDLIFLSECTQQLLAGAIAVCSAYPVNSEAQMPLNDLNAF